MLEQLRQALHYDPKTGIFTWINPPRHHSEKQGKAAGTIIPTRGKQYRHICFGGKRYLSARLAWFYMTKTWPKECIDHINGDSLDDRWCNLREATITENNRNVKRRIKSSGLPMGVRQARSGRYVARLEGNSIGTFDTPEQASIAYRQEREARYGEFA